MAVEAADRESYQTAVQAAELLVHAAEEDKFRRAYRREVRRVAEQYLPLSLEVVREIDLALSRYGLESRRLVAYARHRISCFGIHDS